MVKAIDPDSEQGKAIAKLLSDGSPPCASCRGKINRGELPTEYCVTCRGAWER